MKSITAKMLLGFWVRRIDRWGRYWLSAMTGLYLIHFFFYKYPWLGVEIERGLALTFFSVWGAF